MKDVLEQKIYSFLSLLFYTRSMCVCIYLFIFLIFIIFHRINNIYFKKLYYGEEIFKSCASYFLYDFYITILYIRYLLGRQVSNIFKLILEI